MSQDQGEIPGQAEFAFNQTPEKPNLVLIRRAQRQEILRPTVQLSLPDEGTDKRTGAHGFFFSKGTHGLRIESVWGKGDAAISLLPIGFQPISETSQNSKQDWSFFFIPVFRNATAVIIPDFANNLDIKSVNVALPLKEWPSDRLTDEVVEHIIDSRKILVYPPVRSTSTIRNHDPQRDIFDMYTRIRKESGGGNLPDEVAKKIEETRSENQIRYAAQFKGV